MEQEFEVYWAVHRTSLIERAPKALREERKNNTKMNTAGDWLLFILPIVVMIGFYDSHLIANRVVNLMVTLVLGILVFIGSELLKPYVTRKRSLPEIDADIKEYFYHVYKDKGLKYIEEGGM